MDVAVSIFALMRGQYSPNLTYGKVEIDDGDAMDAMVVRPELLINSLKIWKTYTGVYRSVLHDYIYLKREGRWVKSADVRDLHLSDNDISKSRNKPVYITIFKPEQGYQVHKEFSSWPCDSSRGNIWFNVEVTYQILPVDVAAKIKLQHPEFRTRVEQWLQMSTSPYYYPEVNEVMSIVKSFWGR